MAEISIIIPVYNIEKYISRCLDSVLSQTYKDIEIIVVDDGSTDKSGLICDEYAASDSRIVVIHKENGGLSSARNAGIKASGGNYIMTVDGDDFIAENMCFKLYNSITCNNADMAVCGIRNITENGACVASLDDESPLLNSIITKEEYFRALLCKGSWYYVVAWNKLYKKELFRDVLYPEGKIHEDEYVIHRIVNNCSSVACICDRLYNYVHRSGSITGSAYSVKRLEAISALFDRSRFYIEKDISGSIIAANTVASVKILYQSYPKADIKSKEFKTAYMKIHQELKLLIRDVLSYKMRLDYRLFLTANLMSPFFSYRLLARFIKQ